MIVSKERGRLRTTQQTDHASLAGELAGAWGGRLFHAPEPMAPVRMAAEMHDHGWLDWEREPRVIPETGQPHDFLSLPADEHTALYARGIEMAVQAHPYAGLLVSLHGSGLYRRRYGYMPHLRFKDHPACHHDTIEQYLADQDRLQGELVKDLDPRPETMWTHYRWLQAWDLLSLHICMKDPSEGQEVPLGTLPLHPGGPEVAVTVRGAGPGRFVVEPWPFVRDTLELIVSVRYLPDRPYTSDEDLQNALQAAPTESLPIWLTAE